MSARTSGRALAHPMQKYWWVVLLQGTAVIILSLFLFFKPMSAIFLITLFLGVFFIISGLVDMLHAIFNGKIKDRLGTFVKGMIVLLLGGFIVLSPYFIFTTLSAAFFLVVALGFIVLGGIRIFFKRQDINKRRFTDIIVGIFMVMLGFMMLAAPYMASELLVALLAVWGGVTGIFMIIDAFELRRLK
jgi:uncharacterized membrane protein HdeD (DUF308 family)